MTPSAAATSAWPRAGEVAKLDDLGGDRVFPGQTDESFGQGREHVVIGSGGGEISEVGSTKPTAALLPPPPPG